MDMRPVLPLSSRHHPILQSKDGDVRFFVSRCSAEVAATVDEQALTSALRKLVERHEILHAGPDEAADGSGRPQMSGRPIDLGDGVRLQVLLSDTPAGTLLELRLPAVAADRQTLHNLVAELNATLRDDGGAPLDPAPYALVVQWQQDLLHEPEAQVGIAFWKTKLANPPVTPRLLLEDADPSARFSPARISFLVDAARMAATSALAERLGVSIQAVLVATWKTLLARMTGSSELALGIAYSGRTDESLKEVIGPLARVLPLRLPFHGEIPLRSAIEETDRHLFDAEAWQDCFTGDDNTMGQENGRYSDFTFEMLETVAQSSSSPLRIVDEYVCGQSFRLRLGWRQDGMDLDFDAARLTSVEAKRIGAAFLELLQRVCDDPETPGGAIGITTADEGRSLLEAFCFGPAAAADARKPVHASFLAIAQEFPQRIAVASVDGAISYAELERGSRRVARNLHHIGVGREHVVAILADGSPGMIVAVLGILRAGAAFLPVDCLAPPQRQRAVVENARPSAFLATTADSKASLEPLAAFVSAPLLDHESDASPAEAMPSIPADPEQAAYVLYTSGSTGEPKGVVIPHGALSNHMAWIVSALRLGREDRILQRTPLSFDASIWEVFAPLMTGGCLVQCPREAGFDVDGLLDTIVRIEVTVMQTVPGLLQALLPAGLAGAASLRTLCCGGDVLPARLWEEAARTTGGEFVNLYGPTETCIDASWWREGASRGAPMAIGRPIAGGEMFVVEADALAPVGVRGELFIGGAGLARGYLHQPGSTAAAFVPHPWSASPGARLYRTGDFAFWDHDGAAHFLGRQDDQVKLRGVRMQLEEIRSTVLQHPAVRECAVMLSREDSQARQALLAFVELRADQDPEWDFTAEWQRHVRARLSDTMVPTNFVVLPQMPRTASGKVDRNALELMRVMPKRSQPTTPTERTVAVIWKDLLNLEEIDTEQNFFALGGHSLLLTKLVARITGELHVQVPLRGLFDAPTLSGFAAMIDALKAQPPTDAQARDLTEAGSLSS